MKGKKAIDFILLRPVFTQKNFTAILVVLALMGAYVMISGQNTFKLPNFDPSGEFGTVGNVATPVKVDSEMAQEILGVATNSELEQRLDSVAVRAPLAGADNQDDIEPVNHELGYNFDQQKRKQESNLLKYETRKKDSLDSIAERLNVPR